MGEQCPSISELAPRDEAEQHRPDQAQIDEQAQIGIVVDISSDGFEANRGCAIVEVGAIEDLKLIESKTCQGTIFEHLNGNVGKRASHLRTFERFCFAVLSFERNEAGAQNETTHRTGHNQRT